METIFIIKELLHANALHDNRAHYILSISFLFFPLPLLMPQLLRDSELSPMFNPTRGLRLFLTSLAIIPYACRLLLPASNSLSGRARKHTNTHKSTF